MPNKDDRADRRVISAGNGRPTPSGADDIRGEVTPKQVTADWVYVRLHGPGEPYQGKYDHQTLAGWMRQGRDVYCYFNNDQAGYALEFERVENARTLQAMAGDSDASPDASAHE